MKRLKDFPTQVSRENAVPYEVQIVSYETLDLPETTRSTIGLEQIEALEDFSRLHLKLLSWQSTVEMLQQHPDYFANPPSRENLDRLSGNIQENIIRVRRQAARCSADPKQCDISAMSQVVKDFQMPKLERKTTSLTATSVTLASGHSTFPDLGKNWTYNVPNKNFEAEVRLTTLILDEKLPGAARCIGLGIFSASKSKAIAILRRVDSNGHSIQVCHSIPNNPEVSALGIESYFEDEVHLKIKKQDDQVDLLFSSNGSYWKSLSKQKLSEIGFGVDDTYKVVFTGYATDSTTISGKFYDLMIT
jgi:hypothetical protein